MRASVFALLIGVLHPALLAAQVPASAEFRVNVITTDSQSQPAVAADRTGAFTVVWLDGAVYPNEVRGRRFDPRGTPRGVAFLIKYETATIAYEPFVAADPEGRTVVVWADLDQDLYPVGVFGRVYDSSGAPTGAPFRVNGADEGFAPVAAAGGGGFIVVWESYSPQTGTLILARRFDGSGNALGPEFIVNTYTPGLQNEPSVAADAFGRFVVVWAGNGGNPDSEVFGQRFDVSGAKLGAEFRVNTYTTGTQGPGYVTSDARGNFVVVWHDLQSAFTIVGRAFDASGSPSGAEFVVNTFPARSFYDLSVAADRDGDFTVVWETWNQDGSNLGLFGRRFTGAGIPRGDPFRVNTYTTGAQASPSVASDEAGNLVVAWDSAGQDGWGLGVFGQRFGGLQPASAVADPFATSSSDGNTVLEPGESVVFRPAWRNDSDAPISFAGSIGEFSGPAGATYGIVDGTSAYPPLSPGVTGTGDGYELSVSAPPVRAAAHWDGIATESISPDEQGQHKLWRLHVGDSFADVPRSSPFYVFVETLLHHGVTSGCGATTYCPSNSTTREQMAVFLLLAKEAAGYSPVACTTPVFADVPASSPFCRWIEELARRGVVSGCGSSTTAPATR